MEKIKRISSGIIGFDDKIEGGYVEGTVNFITGKAGTGKTAFCASFLYAGAKNNEKGLYITTEEREEDIRNDIRAMFDWDIDELEKKGLIKIISIRPDLPMKTTSEEGMAKVVKLYMYNLLSRIENEVKKMKAKRLVVDSVSLVEIFIKDEYLRKIALMKLIDKLKELNVTSILTGTIPEDSGALSISGFIEFLTDSIIKLDFVPIAEEFRRTVTIRKMRRTNHSVLIHPFEITKRGIKILEIKEV